MAFVKIGLSPARYDGFDGDFYSVPASNVDEVYAKGGIPEISFDCNGPAVALVIGRYGNGAKKDYGIAKSYVDALCINGARPVFLTYGNTQEQLEHFKPAAILLPGGDFPAPREWYVNDPIYSGADLGRFGAYMAALDYARENRLPALGVCAGEQVMAGALGGKLASGINIPDAMINHREKDAEHYVAVIPGTLLHRVVGKDALVVNSFHNEAVVGGGGFKVSAFAPDGTIEAIEPAEPWSEFVLGVQWHPEKLAAAD
ncbi:MAG: gamma-glutamyl-gamma-aminobutyrate hydrolase family protein, partial [Rickettsiales bacterium]|nr:gamma-glutamyl-gamma-aminobutyrate hydrolase family protein [Rickettsiales bacterium]